MDHTAPSVAADPPTALISHESIVIDGANGVTAAPRGHFPDAVSVLALALVVAVVVRFSRARPWVAFGLLALAAVPGLFHVLLLRADGPFRRPALAAVVSARVEELKTLAPWPGVQVVREADDVFFPLGRYAAPSRPVVDGGVPLELGAGPLSGAPCTARSGRVVCGASP